MYQCGDYVVKTNNGVCKVEDIVHLDIPGVDKKKQYYLLIPLEDKGAKVYVPVDNTNSDLREVMSEKDAWAFIEKIPEIESTWIPNDKQREQDYKTAMKSGKPEDLVGIIKNMYFRKKVRIEQGKKNTAVDERYFRLAENALYSELAFAIGREKTEMEQLIFDAVSKK